LASRPEANLERGAFPEVRGDRLLPGRGGEAAAELLGMKPVRWRDEISARQPAL